MLRLQSLCKQTAIHQAMRNPIPIQYHNPGRVLCCADGSPFDWPAFSKSAFLTLLTPMVKRLSLCNMKAAIGPAHFAAICELSSLEDLSILASWDDQVCFPTRLIPFRSLSPSPSSPHRTCSL